MKRTGYEDYQATKARREGGKWSNIISHMDALWHGEEGPDGCSKCTRYEEILYNAFDHIDELSNRSLNDMATMHRDDMIKDVDEEKLKKEWAEHKYFIESGGSLIERREEVEEENYELEEENTQLKADNEKLQAELDALRIDYKSLGRMYEESKDKVRVSAKDVNDMVKNVLNIKETKDDE